MLKSWFEDIPETNLTPLTKVLDGDDAKSNRYVDGVLKQAKEEGWVLNPQWANPGAQDYIEPDEQQAVPGRGQAGVDRRLQRLGSGTKQRSSRAGQAGECGPGPGTALTALVRPPPLLGPRA